MVVSGRELAAISIAFTFLAVYFPTLFYLRLFLLKLRAFEHVILEEDRIDDSHEALDQFVDLVKAQLWALSVDLYY